MTVLTLVQANSAAQLTKEVNNLLGFNYALVGGPFAIDSLPHQMMLRQDDSVTPGREYILLIRYGENTMINQLDEHLAQGWTLYGNVFTLGHLPVQAVIQGDIPIIGESSSGTGTDWSQAIETSKRDCNKYTDTQMAESGIKIDARFERVDEAIQLGDKSVDTLNQRISVAEGVSDSLSVDISNLTNNTEASLGRLSNELTMERNERNQDVVMLQKQIDALTLLVNRAETKNSNSLPDESTWR